MMFSVPTPEDLGLRRPSWEDVIATVSGLPFEAAMLACSLVAGILFHHPRDRRRHQALAEELHPPWLADRMRHFLAADPSHIGFDARHVTALQRLLVTRAMPDPETGHGPGLSKDQVEQLMVALIGLASVLPQLEPPDVARGSDGMIDRDTVDWAGWAAYTVRAGAWYDQPHVADAMARAHAFYVDAHNSDELLIHPARQDVEAWVAEDIELTLAQQLAGGFACALKTGVLSPNASIEERARHIGPGFLSEGAMANHEAALRAAISATRAELADMLRAGGEDPVRVAWDHTSFEQRPFLRMRDGTLRLISPAGLVSWMTRGIHYRALQAAERRPHPRKADASMSLMYLGYAGALGEEAVRRLIKSSHQQPGRTGGPRFYGEHPYKIRKNKHLSPDAALDFGADVILFEVYAGRMPLAARAGADNAAMLKAVDKATAVKLTELSKRTTEFLNGDLRYPGIDLGRVERVWPVVVLAGDPILQTQALWAYLRERARESFLEDRRVQRAVIVDLDDLDPMLGEVERGAALPELLAAFLESEFAELPPRNWMHQRFPESLTRRPTYVRAQYEEAGRMAATALYPDSDFNVSASS